jgi:predicted ATPase
VKTYFDSSALVAVYVTERFSARARQSVGTYLHGSFGSGKSHFMAVLSLILGGHRRRGRNPSSTMCSLRTSG